MIEWFYAREGQQYGPVTFEQLVALARSGGLSGRDSVWNATMQGWTPAGQVPGIFDLFTGPEIPASNTYAASNASAAPNPYLATNTSTSSNPYAAPESGWRESDSVTAMALTEILPGSQEIDAMECISRGYEIFKRQFANILLVGLVYLGCVMGISIVFSIIEAVVSATSSRGNQNPGEMGSIVIAVTLISQVIQQVVAIFLKLGLARVGLNLVSGKEVSIGMLFGEGSKFLRAFGASILFGIAMVIGLVLLIVPGIYIALRYGQFLNAIVDRDLGIMEAFDYSSSITENNLMNLFVLGLLSFVAVIVGMILCGIGLIVAGPVVWLASLVAYRWLQYGPRAAKDHPGTEKPMLSSL